ncbi:pilus assembly protein CpaE [Yersinia enterocolitica]|uniref:pilus assembly protein CpaE n=1 Tax=Yersinia enterocolitica TaxID=630 RepID=UPI0028E016BB|nr:pilus assembly protein CpaE [Yersinia enterocolitica]HDZ9832050.1 pilus assembly protein CpaE [Yersinia enterocolitica]HEC1639910.1 pilus assembly protein CpaE [Yersinia enterocolitica]HEN3297374.1 pilus assembly protein CpaE [Yersinia enterocolitica]
MQLILNKELINRKDNKIKSNIVIVSTRKWVIEKVSEKIRLADINDIKEIDKDIFNLSTINTPEKTVGFIIDIGNNEDVEKILSLIKSNTPRDCWCVLVGDIDSISVAQKFTERGILYLNVQSQSIELTQHLLKGIPIEMERKAFFISILGCKGGIGTTLLSYHFSCEITQIKKSPTLLLQGNQGSQDLDLVTEKKMTSEINEYHKNIDIMLCKGNELSDIDIKIGRKHNYIVFDQSIHNSPKEKLTDYIEHSDCIIILLDNSMTSVRVAKDFIDIYDRFKRDNRQTTRLIVCLNESRPIAKNMLNTSDIQSLLGRKIDTQIPYISKTKESLVDKNYFGRNKVKIIDLAKNTLGINVHLSKNGKSWINKIAASLK